MAFADLDQLEFCKTKLSSPAASSTVTPSISAQILRGEIGQHARRGKFVATAGGFSLNIQKYSISNRAAKSEREFLGGWDLGIGAGATTTLCELLHPEPIPQAIRRRRSWHMPWPPRMG